jgi:hypothetical protein
VSGRALLQELQASVAAKIRQDFLTSLPEEMAYHILGFLGTRELLTAAGVCRQWRRLAENDKCVRSLDARCFPPHLSSPLHPPYDVILSPTCGRDRFAVVVVVCGALIASPPALGSLYAHIVG